MLDRTRLKEAFGRLGDDLTRRGLYLDLYVSIHREPPREEVTRRLAAVLEQP